MKGLIYKDLLSLKQVAATIGLLAVFYIVLGYMNHGSDGGMVNYFPMLAMIVSLMVPLNCAGFDEQCDWDSFGNALPVNRRQMVMARYGACLTVTVIAALIAVVMDIVYHFAFGMPLRVLELCYPLILSLLYLSVSLPIIYKFGANKARLIIVLVMVVPVLLAVMAIFGVMALSDRDIAVSMTDIAQSVSETDWEGAEEIDLGAVMNKTQIPASVIGIVVSGIVYALSCLLSVSIYEKKKQ